MLNKIKQRKDSGFTIIEVLIVLAIAGLIMVVVFLAVPNLQRSQRNNSISSDANNIFTAIGNYVADDNGQVPTTFTAGSGNVQIGGAAGANTETVDVGGNFSSISSSSVITTSANQIKAATVGAAGVYQIATGTQAVCNSTKTGLGGTGVSRSYALLYSTDAGGGKYDIKCLDNN